MDWKLLRKEIGKISKSKLFPYILIDFLLEDTHSYRFLYS